MSKEIWVFAIGFLSFLTLVSAQTPLQLSPVISTDKIDFYRTGKNTAVQTQTLEKISITGNTDNRDYLNVRRVQLLRILISILFITLIALIFFISYQRKTRKERDKVLLQLYKNEQELVKSKYEIKISKAEMKAARARINPHLLFNSLNAVHYLLQTGEVEQADKYLIKLSRFYRMILELPKNDLISLDEEIELIKYYVALEEIRFQNDLELEINTLTDVEMRQIKIPPLLLQPYVENAFWHGLIPSGKTNKQLSIQVSRKNENIEISIKDNGVGRHFEKTDLDKNKFKKEKRGLEIIEERILQFNKSYECKIQSEIKDLINEQRENCGTQVIITITGCINKSN